MTTALVTRDTIATATGKELLAFFNAHTGGNQLVKFQNRAQGKARVLALIAEMEAEQAGDQKAAIAACKRGESVFEAVTIESLDRADAALADQAARLAKMEWEAKIAKKLAAAAKKAPSAQGSSIVKPYQGAKAIVADCIARGITARKEIIAAGLAAGITYNTIDGAHYTMCVKKN